jgi:hypothetical protein
MRQPIVLQLNDVLIGIGLLFLCSTAGVIATTSASIISGDEVIRAIRKVIDG